MWCPASCTWRFGAEMQILVSKHGSSIRSLKYERKYSQKLATMRNNPANIEQMMDWNKQTLKRNSSLLIHLGDPVVGVPAPVDPILQELDALEQVVLEGGRLARREDVHPGERRGNEIQAVVGQVQAVVLPLLDYVLKHLRRKSAWFGPALRKSCSPQIHM